VGGLLCALVLLCYSNSFQGGFVLDNRVLILEDARVHRVSFDNLTNILNHSYWWPIVESGLYRPLTTFSYLVNYAVLGNGDRPAGYHVVNLLVHMANVLLVLALGLRLSRNRWLATAIASVWAVHPVATEAVSNIIGRADLLAALGSLGALFAYIKARDSDGHGRSLWLLVVMGAVTVGVFAKESAIAIVGVAILYDIAVVGRRLPTVDLVSGWLAFVPPLALMWYMRSAVLGGVVAAKFPFVDNPIVGAGFWQGRLTALAVIGRYLELVAWPARLSPDYSYSQIPLASGALHEWIAWTVVAVVAAITIVSWRGHRTVGFLLVAAMVMFLPVSNLAFPTGTIMAERLLYLPSAGVIAALVAGLFALEQRIRAPKAAAALVALLVMALGVRTWMRNADWHSEVSLWSAAVETAPNSFKTHGALAEALYNADPTRGNLPLVIAEKEKSLAILASVPDPAAASLPYREAATYYLELGDRLRQEGRAPTEPDVAAAYRKAAESAKKFLALAETAKAVSASDINAAQMIASTAYERLNESEGAIAAGRSAVTLQPYDPKAYQVTAAAYVSAGRNDDAAVALMAGFIVTGDKQLRALLIQLYQSGLDRGRCAVSSTPNGPVLNSGCELVARHLCAAGFDAMAIQRQQGHPELASRIQATTLQGLGCSADGSMQTRR
jgi:protein O-mannosyl-transferase